MNFRVPVDSTAQALELPSLIRLDRNLYGARFTLMKLLPARFILDQARKEHRIWPGATIAETTSGTFGLALAILCATRGYKLILVSDPAIDLPMRRRLEDLGATVEICVTPAPEGGFQRARLDLLNEILARSGAFCPSQYHNPHNPGAYAPFAELLVESLGQIDCLVGTVGSGGSMCGTGSYLRNVVPDLRVIGVDTRGSVLFGQEDRKRLLRGLGNSLIPRNLDHKVFDDVHWVSAAEAFCATRLLHREHGLFMGGTSGASFMVARWWAERHPDQVTVALLPDEGHRYQDSIYDDAWMAANYVLISTLPFAPVLVEHPSEARDGWTQMRWGRRTLDQVMEALPEASSQQRVMATGSSR
jgi:S-sulfo-L-cysteine synthase (3-phospho-L-serine-dependent)